MTRHCLVVSVALVGASLAGAENWPGWRGPSGDGRVRDRQAPLTWSQTENVLWKVALPEPGNSSPIIWEDRVFITQSTDNGKTRAVHCYNRANGDLLWTGEITYEGEEPKHATNTYCAATPVTDGKRVIASHGSAGLVCYDFDGQELWRKDLGPMIHIWGNASSPILYRDLVILWAGPGEQQFLVALNKHNGEEVWRHDEAGGNGGDDRKNWVGSWTTPVLMEIQGREELILPVPKKVKAFDPSTGEQLWCCGGLGNLVYASPVFSDDGIVFAASGYGGPALAVRGGCDGEVTLTNRLWDHPQRNPQRVGSAVVHEGDAYLINEKGEAMRLNLETGEDSWLGERLPGNFWSSPVLAQRGIYITSRSGDTFVLEVGPEPKELARNPLGEHTEASPAIADGQIFIRTYEHLWCIAEKP